MEFIIDFELEDFVQMGYPKQIRDFDIDLEVCLNGCVFDIENGLILNMGEG